MNLTEFLLPIFQYSAAGIIIFFVGWYFYTSYADERNADKYLEMRKALLSQTLPLRLQAYERVILFLDRINPSNLLIRLNVPGMNVATLQQQILAEIRAEYQHNISQQLYINPKTWQIVERVKEDTVVLINNVVRSLPPDAPASELSKLVLTHLINLETDNPYQSAASLVKNDIQQLF